MGAYLFFICATHRPFRMILYFHLTSRWVNPRHLVVVGRSEGGLLLLIPVFEVSGTLRSLIGVGSNRLYLPPVPRRMCELVVCSRL